MFGNSIVLTVGGVGKTLTKISQDGYVGEYFLRDTLDSYRLKIRHSIANVGSAVVDRHNVEVTHITYATSTVKEIKRKVYLVFEQDTTDTMTNVVKALADWLIASTNAAIVSMGNWES